MLKNIIDRLLALGLAPIPVAPYQDPNDKAHRFYKYLHQSKKVTGWNYSVSYEPILEADGTLKPKFTGKNPSFLKADGFPKTVEHKHYQNTLPTQEDFELWFANAQNGIGCLGNHRYRWLDLDRKHFDSQGDCDRALLQICPHAKDGWLERTQSGGYRLLVDCGESGVDFTNFALTEGGDHVGELLGAGRYAVLSPTVGVSGSYTNINYGEPIPLTEINIYPTSPKKAAAVIKPSLPIPTTQGAIELFNCITPATQSIIAGTPESDDRSLDLTKAAKELYGWENWLSANGISFSGSADTLINDCGEAFDIDSDRIERIKKSIDATSCLPACVIRGGDESAIAHVKKLQRAINPAMSQDLRYASKIENPSNINLLSLLPKKYIEAVKYGIDSPLTHITTVKGLAVTTEAYLISKSIKYDGSAKKIFSQFCQNQDDSTEADFDGTPFDKGEKIDIPNIKKLLAAHDRAQTKLHDRIERERAKQERELLKAQHEADEICYVASNIKIINDAYGDRFKLNELTNEIELDGKFFDMDRSRAMFGIELNITISKSDAYDAIRMIGEENSYHPVKDYLDDCYKKYGDNTNILSDLAAKCFGSSNPLYEIFLQKTLVAAVARIYKPGCKVDSVLCLVGKQGYQKSTFFEALAGAESFTDNLDKELSNKDNVMRLHRKWICEIGEIDRVANSRYEGDLKNFITIKTDLFRMPYAMATKEYKRGFLFVGTSNRHDFLTDPTGDRRYWLIQVSKKIDTTFIEANRDLIWAAAVSLYKSNTKWYLSDLEKEASDRNNERYRSDSHWMPQIAEFCKAKPKVSCTELLYHIERDASRHTASMQRDCRNCLERLGFTKSNGKHRINIEGKLMTVNSWIAPNDPLGGSLGGSSFDADVVSVLPEPPILGGSLGGSSFNVDVASDSEEMIHLIHQKRGKVFVEKNICNEQENQKTDAYIFEEKSFEAKTLDHVDHLPSNVDTEPKPHDPPNDPPQSLSGSCGSQHITVFDIGKMVTDTRTGYSGELKSFELNSEGKTIARFGDQIASPEFLRVIT